MSELDDKLNDEREELRQKSLKYGYKSLTKEEKTQQVYDIYEEVYTDDEQLDGSSKNIEKYSVVKNQDIQELVNLKDSLNNTKQYYYQENLHLSNHIILYILSIIFATVATIFIFSNIESVQDNEIRYYFLAFYLPIIFAIIATILRVFQFKSKPKIYQMIKSGNNKLFSFYDGKKPHLFVDGTLFIHTEVNLDNCYKMGKNFYKNSYKLFEIDNLLYSKRIKVNEQGNLKVFSCKQIPYENDYSIAITTDNQYKAKKIYLSRRGRYGNGVSFKADIRYELPNNKFYLPTPLKAYLEKKGVDYLNDSRIEFVDNIYEVLKASKKAKEA